MEIKKGKKLSNYAAEALLTPFANKDSVSRLAMFKSALTHSVVVANNPDIPLVDSKFSKDLIISSDNYKSKGKVKLLAKIPKIIDGYITEMVYLYYDYGIDKVDMEVVPTYERYYKFGYKCESELEKMEVNEDSEDSVYTKYLYNIDTDDGRMYYGKNINFIYNCSREVGEDAIIITEQLAKELSLNYSEEIEVMYSPDNFILKDLYGYKDEEDNIVYKPFPSIGEEISKEMVLCISDVNENNFLTTSNDIYDSDQVKYVHKGARVCDITVFHNNKIKVPYLESLRAANMEYIKQISIEINKLRMSDYYATRFSDAFEYKAQRYMALLNNNLRVGRHTLKNKVYIKIKTINTRPLGIGDKITNRDGGKGTIGGIIPKPLIAEDGTEIHMIINTTGIVNRENSGQLFEKELNSLNIFLQKYLQKSNDSIKDKYNNIIKWCDLAYVPDLVKAIKKEKPEDIVELYSNDFIYLRYDPYVNPLGFLEFHRLREFTSSLYPDTGGQTIYYNGIPMSDKHIYGRSFYMVLENGTIKDTSIRTDGMVNIKGALSKKGASRKKHQTKWGTTASKISDLGLSIILNYFKPEDRKLLQNNVDILDDYLQGLGVRFSLQKKKI